MRGTTTIELTNVKTGKKEIIRHDNMVTNAIRDILQLNPSGVGYRMSSPFSNLCFPIAGKLIGGIQLFENSIEEDADKYFAPYDNPVTGYASMDVNTGTDPRRGSLNQLESGELPNREGYRFVWDFTTSQGNGVISSLGLCDVEGGKASAGGEYLLNTELYKLYSANILSNAPAVAANTLFGIFLLEPENNCALSIFLSASKEIRIRKVRVPITAYGVNESISRDPSIDFEDVTTLFPESFGYYTGSTAYLAFCYDDNGFVWGFQHDGNANGNSSGNANVRWIKINISDWSFEEGTWTVNAQIFRFGYTNPTSPDTEYCCIIHKDNLYCRKNDGYGIYKIDLNNPTDVVLLPDAGRSSGTHAYIPLPYLTYSSSSGYYYGYTLFNVIGGTIIFPGGHIVDDVIHCRDVTSLGTSTNGRSYAVHPKLQYGPFVYAFYRYSSTIYVDILLIRTYLATINNLPQTVEKTADKTMKITYTLYETDDTPQDPDPEPEP